MKKYTQEEFDALPLVDGVRQCPTGDYTQIMNFGAWCSFEGDHKALAGYPILSFGGGGSVNRTVYAFNVENGPLVRAGCFVGTLDAFRAKVRRDDDRLKSLQYLGFANIVAATWCPERIEK
ncbi:MAG: hypothetical protein WC829_01660 [Hyphomicrobium sp.]|jgi:hypothetical protein